MPLKNTRGGFRGVLVASGADGVRFARGTSTTSPDFETIRHFLEVCYPGKRIFSPLEKMVGACTVVSVFVERTPGSRRLGTFHEWAVSLDDE